MQKHHSHSAFTFLQFIKRKEQLKGMFLLCLLALVIFFLVLFLYPTLFISGDSYVYLFGAAKDFNVYRPMGYSRYLQALHQISPYSNFVLLTQYWIHIISTLIFVFTIKYFFPIKNRKQTIAFYCFALFVIFSPSLINMTNLLNSDSLFISLTLGFITSLIWIIASPSILMIGINLLLCYATFQLRYAGWFYPVISSLVFIIHYENYKKIIAILPIVLLLILISNKTQETYSRYHVKSISGFNGWQLANNAMHILPYIDLAPESFKDENLVILHRMARTIDNDTYEKLGLTFDYMWHKDYPLKQFCFRKMHKDHIYFFDAWTKCGSIFNDYGKILIIKYPIEYLQHFILPNFISVFYQTNCEVLSSNTILNSDNYWFKDVDYKLPLFDPYHTWLFPLMPFFVSILWMFYFGCTVYLLLSDSRKKQNNIQHQIIQFVQIFILIFISFYVVASPITLRFILGINALQLFILYIASIQVFSLNEN